MVDFSDGSLVTPERIVVLSVFSVGISGGREDLVPECGVAVRVRNTVWWLSMGGEGKSCAWWPETLRHVSPPPQLAQHGTQHHVCEGGTG